jgi:adenylate cyclase
MAEERAKRKLSGILSADAVGYSRLMEKDEESTIRTLADSKELMVNLIQQYRGRVVDAPGDNLLAEFGSVVDATECAVKIQQELKAKNAELPEKRRMDFRIGVNLGDVIEEADRIYGDGVNIAARLEGLALPGGICISRTAYDHVKNKLELGYEYLGEHSVKNITEPVRVYRVLMEPEAVGKVIGEKRLLGRISRKIAITAIVILIVFAGGLVGWNIYLHQSRKVEPASIENMAYPIPDKPSIAVLPFTNISNNPDQDFFCDGITEEIITGLSKISKLFVIARNSTFTYKGKPVKVQKVAEDLGVQYVLEGSVQRSKDRLRVTVQLIDALNGKHLWAEKYDRILKDIFALQDEITFKVIAALQVKLTDGEQALIAAWGTTNFEAYVKLLQGIEYVRRFNKEGNLLGRKLAEEVIALDPGYPQGYGLLGRTHVMDVWFGSTESPRKSLAEAVRLFQKVIAMYPSAADYRGLLGFVYTMMRQHEKSIAEFEKAIALNPNVADNHAWFGFALHLNGKHKEALVEIKKAIRLNPFPPNIYFLYLGNAYMYEGMYDESIAAYKKALRVQPNNLFTHIRLAAIYSLLGREEEAHAEAAEVLRINPQFSLEYFSKTIPFKNQSDTDHLINALRKAGLK